MVITWREKETAAGTWVRAPDSIRRRAPAQDAPGTRRAEPLTPPPQSLTSTTQVRTHAYSYSLPCLVCLPLYGAVRWAWSERAVTAAGAHQLACDHRATTRGQEKPGDALGGS